MAERARDRLRSVRVRTTAVVVGAVAVVAVGGGAVLVASLGGSLTDELAATGRLRAVDLVRDLEDGEPPAGLGLAGEEDRFVQVVDAHGTVVAATPEATGPVPGDAPAPGGASVETTGPPGDDDERYVVVAEVATGAGPGGEDLTVLVGQEAETVEEATDALTATLRTAVPLVVALVALATWWLVGRALAPVDAIRRRVEEVSADRLDARVPVPPTGDEVARLATTMNAMLTRLQLAQDRQRRFVSDAGHELRSPATAIRQQAEVGLAHPGRTSTDELARTVLAEGRRLEQLVEHLLWLARDDERGSAGQLPTAGSRPVDLDDVVLEEAARARPGARVAIDTAAVSAGAVRGDAEMLRRMVDNLLDNAVRHATGNVRVGLRDDESGTVRLSVDDDGAGIPAADRDRVLERFVRLDDARTRDAGGSGLGLAIVRATARSHGGEVTVGTSVLGGARLEVALPSLDGPPDPVDGPGAGSAGRQDPTASVVDNDEHGGSP